ncbi:MULTISPECIES: efflux RND transporter periplasmic adaptor subunit [Enterobacterales]|uniref:efflux RND transporter periplasmic adaptor subunit n=1 Tax=Enterobacterales TaxID=91347 RepID=UPI001FEDB3A6|nr:MULTISPECIES: efflux RND transporter periplasmic adaptor subunit [Enterobacterales]MDT7052020.1 efflux RND transporter periplasmic adaptor subunit [Providencia stuartii]UPG21482.1 efflux RND transporter periplasmic adaptor subunit [Klebsiella pneumoniae]UPG23537.1 efflux RND transporter periplasmic adaptor subunit [Klebsiella pneumoniae]UPG23952.1 efflux RND transporter periplasmic adaptor subunit [Providencia stuartii]UPG24264.1 efflux RND transporter periplasmic adaptor subunit [Providenc
MKSSKQLNVVHALLVITLAGCSPEMPDMTTPPPPVSILEVKPLSVELKDDLTGRVAPVRVAEIRPQVTGIIQERLFVQGADVRAGQPLFQINPAPFKAEVETSAAALMRAEAALSRAQIQVKRLQPLVEGDAVSRQTYDDAVSAKEQAAAEVAQAKAELSRRKLDLQFSTVDSPINGRIEQSIVSEGALVSPSDNTSLAKVQQINEVYVDVRQPAESLDLLREATEAGKKELHVEILKASGKPFDVEGKVLFSGLTVDEATGDVLVRILVNNIKRELLPGMFVRARLTLASFDDALLVPQEAVTRTGDEAWVWLLSEGNKVRQVHVQLGELIDRSYRIEKGIKAGDKVIVSGLDRMSEGAEVTPSNAVQPTVDTATSSNTSIGERE